MAMLPRQVTSVDLVDDGLDDFVLSLRVRYRKMLKFYITVDSRSGPVGKNVFEFDFGEGERFFKIRKNMMPRIGNDSGLRQIVGWNAAISKALSDATRAIVTST